MRGTDISKSQKKKKEATIENLMQVLIEMKEGRKQRYATNERVNE